MTIEQYAASLRATFAPERTHGIHAILQYVFEGSQTGSCYAIVDDGTLEVATGMHPAPTVTVTSDFDLWMRLITYKEDPLLAYQDGRYRVVGDLETLLDSDSWFPRPPLL